MSDPVQALTDAFPLPTVLIGADQQIAAFNPSAKALLPPITRGQPCASALRQPEVTRAIARAAESAGAETCTIPLRVNQQEHQFLVKVSPVSGMGFLICLEDQTEIAAAHSIRRDFVANVSHELRTPLTAMLGFVETLRGPARNDPAASARFLDMLNTEALRMSALIRDLLELSRVEENERRRPSQPVDLGALLQSVAATLEPNAEKSGVTLSLSVTAEPLVLPGDSEELRRLALNLVENALRYGASGGRVEIEAAPAGADKIALVVRDFGEGIEPHHIPRLTERFYRVDAHRSRMDGGTGLGLSIVKHIVARHRGRLTIESIPKVRTEFRVTLPSTLG